MNALERDDFQAGNKLEVFGIQRSHIEAKIESGRSYNKVFKGNEDTECSLFSFNAPGKLGYFKRNRICGNAVKQVFSKFKAMFALFIRLRTVNSMRQFDDGDCGKADFSFAICSLDPAEKLVHGVSAPLPCD